jgi:CubicO group peptidase (beta-lactamase class C family)
MMPSCTNVTFWATNASPSLPLLGRQSSTLGPKEWPRGRFYQSAADPITDYIPELAERDPRQGIQIRHLLQMASGLRYEDDRTILPEDDNLTYGFDDLRHLALTETEVVEEPGVTFLYNTYNPLLLGLILERATGMEVTSYLQQKIWTPLGMEFDGSWSLDEEGF